MGKLCPWLCLDINSRQHILYIFCCCCYYPTPLSLPRTLFSSVTHLLPCWPQVRQWVPLANKKKTDVLPHCVAVINPPPNHHKQCCCACMHVCVCASQPPASYTRSLLNTYSSPSCHTDWPHPAPCDLASMGLSFSRKEGREVGRERGKWANPEWKQTGSICWWGIGGWRLT